MLRAGGRERDSSETKRERECAEGQERERTEFKKKRETMTRLRSGKRDNFLLHTVMLANASVIEMHRFIMP